MKRMILMLIIVALATTMSFSQTDSIPQLVTVKDTTYRSDPRLDYMKNTISVAVASFMDDYNRTQKVAGNTILLKSETNQLTRKIEKLVADYALYFMEVKDVQINLEEIINEFNALNTKIEALQSDPEIKYLEAMSEFKRIKDRQAVLANYYKQIYK